MFRSRTATFVITAVASTALLVPHPIAAQGALSPGRIAAARSAPPAGPPAPRLELAVRRAVEPEGVAREVGIWVGALGVALASSAVGDPPPLDCRPCDRNAVPFFDRWAITGTHQALDELSNGTLLAVAGVAWATTLPREGGLSRFGASVESAAIAVATTQLLKNAVGRARPYTYVEGDPTPIGVDAKQSWPSGHATTAFALATSFWLNSPERHRTTSRLLVGGAAVFTAILRVAAGQHFPTDVVAGAAIGIGSALTVQAIRF